MSALPACLHCLVCPCLACLSAYLSCLSVSLALHVYLPCMSCLSAYLVCLPVCLLSLPDCLVCIACVSCLPVYLPCFPCLPACIVLPCLTTYLPCLTLPVWLHCMPTCLACISCLLVFPSCLSASCVASIPVPEGSGPYYVIVLKSRWRSEKEWATICRHTQDVHKRCKQKPQTTPTTMGQLWMQTTVWVTTCAVCQRAGKAKREAKKKERRREQQNYIHSLKPGQGWLSHTTAQPCVFFESICLLVLNCDISPPG